MTRRQGPSLVHDRIAHLMWCAIVSMLVTGCSALSPLPSPIPAVATREWTSTIKLHDSSVDLHLAAPTSPTRPAVLVLFASGDGGWFGSAVGMFRAIAANGYATVGLSSRALLKVERGPEASLHPQQLAQDYARILDDARKQLGVPPETPAVLTGWSRGAAFAVLAAAAMPSRRDAAGVIAIGLAEGEDLRADGTDNGTDDDDEAASPAGAPRFEPYRTLVRVLSVPSAVIQATGDKYLPAARARALFGPDTQTRRFWEIPGRNHRFDGAGQALVDSVGEALRWGSSRSNDVVDR